MKVVNETTSIFIMPSRKILKHYYCNSIMLDSVHVFLKSITIRVGAQPGTSKNWGPEFRLVR